jgi:nucleoside-diphosphate-sugar epimerase
MASNAVIFGSKGRFARSLVSEINNSKSYSYDDFVSQPFDLSSEKIEALDAFWTFGSGSQYGSNLFGEISALEKFLKMLQKKKIAISSFSYLSSGGTIYGENISTASENASLDPISVYAKNKLRCEQLVMEEVSNYVEQIRIYRLANAYTLDVNNRNPKGLIESLFASGLSGDSVRINVNGESRRQYGSHLDYIKIILSISNVVPVKNDKLLNVFNIYPPYDLSINQIIFEISNAFNVQPQQLVSFMDEDMVSDSLILTSNFESIWQKNHVWSDLRWNVSRALA